MRFNIKKKYSHSGSFRCNYAQWLRKEGRYHNGAGVQSTIVSEILQNNDSVSCNISSKQNDIDIFTYFDKDYRYFYQVLEGKTSEYLVQMGTKRRLV